MRPRELMVDDASVGAGTMVQYELARRLYRARVATLAVDCGTSPGELARFCRLLVGDGRHAGSTASFAERLIDHGVSRIVPVMLRQPQVLDLGMPNPQRQELMLLEREHRATAPGIDGVVAHFYPPDRGWVRLDPIVRLQTVSLADLAILVDDPTDLAAMLLRLTGDVAEGSAPLEEKLSDVAMLFASLSPNLAQLLFSKLARAVLALDTERRARLLHRTILPGLLDGRVDGRVLRDFPDIDLVEALCALLDLETAAPDVLRVAVDRLNLPVERLKAVAPLLERRARESQTGPGKQSSARRSAITRHVRRLLQVDSSRETAFADFRAFDLSMDDEARIAIAGIRDGIGAGEPLATRLACLKSLISLEPNPAIAEALLRRASLVLDELERKACWEDLAEWLAWCRRTTAAFEEPRPEVAQTVAAAIRAFYTRERVSRLRELYERDAHGRAVATRLVAVGGSDIAPVFVALLDASPSAADAQLLTEMMSDHAAALAPALVAALATCRVDTARAVVRVLSHGGRGCERSLAVHLHHRDEPTVLEILRALTRIATVEAAAIVAGHLREGPLQTRHAAEQALWHFPRELAQRQVLALLGQGDFVRRRPGTATSLLKRIAYADRPAVEPLLRQLASLRFHVWNPGLVRVGLTARRCLNQ